MSFTSFEALAIQDLTVVKIHTSFSYFILYADNDLGILYELFGIIGSCCEEVSEPRLFWCCIGSVQI